jgi:RNA polymerase sigma factor (sigma-70 family)
MEGQETDFATIQLVLQGQQSAFATLVNKYQSYVFTIALKYVPNREAAEELTQDVFVKMYKSLADFKGNSKLSTWLYSICHNTCVSYLRKKQLPSVYVSDQLIARVADIGGGTIAADAQMEQKSRALALETAIAQLPETDAEIVTLYYLADQSIDDIARILGLTTSNVKVKLFRARQKLRELLSGVI